MVMPIATQCFWQEITGNIIGLGIQLEGYAINST